MISPECVVLRQKTVFWNRLSGLGSINGRFISTALLLTTLSILASSSVLASDVPPLAKIAPPLASEIAFGGTSEALIVFEEQADLSGAANLPTKLEKGQFVYNALRAVAERTQAPMRKLLQERGISFQSFYGVNMIKITASRDLLFELAGRNEVLDRKSVV